MNGRRVGRIGRRAIGLLGLAGVALVTLALWAGIAGITLSAAHWRVPVGSALSAALGREVWVQGPMTLRIGWASRLRLEQVHVRNPAGFDDVDALYLSAIEARVALMPWLRSGRLHLETLQADQAVLNVAHDSAGRLNWADIGSADAKTPASGDEPIALVIEQLRVARLQIDYLGRGGDRRKLSLTDIRANVAQDAPMHVAFRGLADDLFAFEGSLDLGSLATLRDWQAGRAPWPLAGELRALGATLTADGAWRPDGLSLQLGFGAPEPARAAQMVGIALPPLGPAALVTHLATADGRLR
ncbi:MAG: hypothetical protein R3E68_21920 [Burkholderiaceae bacterium]